MKRLYWGLAALLCCLSGASTSCSTQTDPDVFVIEGKLDVEGPIKEGTTLFLVPMYGPHPRPVDSLILDQTGKFRFEGNVEQMAVLRLGWRHRYGVEELIVCTEPGHLNVSLGEDSRAWGTPQNDSLQRWKDELKMVSQRGASFREMLKMNHDTASYRESVSIMRENLGEFNYRLLHNMGRQTSSMFMFTRFSGTLDSLRRAELETLLKDTTDYRLPQPGFRR